ncbi:aldehyde dehydrogenase family protein [Bradyrhizobium sp. CCBAU 53421]|uniref:aldehyde dehydrogenase family protein n=1 Tax=Bradyrhizobium sp. CCBAU 53421 TaxID=1325120 RepID=UPI0018C0011E|nr:hypothetical protein XH92_36270 [Bradyrhizobium sp. CCBAU 53421]
MCSSIEEGQIFVNNYGSAEAPFGGVKRSGLGLENGFEEVVRLALLKRVAIRNGI